MNTKNYTRDVRKWQPENKSFSLSTQSEPCTVSHYPELMLHIAVLHSVFNMDSEQMYKIWWEVKLTPWLFTVKPRHKLEKKINTI